MGQILKRAAERDERFVVDRRGEPAVIIMSIRDYLRNIAPTPLAYKLIREKAKREGSNSLILRDIDREIASVRRERARRNKKKSAA